MDTNFLKVQSWTRICSEGQAMIHGGWLFAVGILLVMISITVSSGCGAKQVTPTGAPLKQPPSAEVPTPNTTPPATSPPTQTPSPTSKDQFYIYQDADTPDNHYKPTGYMGDTGDIHIDEAFDENPHKGKTSIRVVYDAKGKGPNECPYSPPCKWAGVYWQEPPNNWGKNPDWKGRGFNLSRYNRLMFWARADKPIKIEFQVGGINEPYGDSLVYPRKTIAKLSQNWQEFEIDLSGADLTRIIGGFVWVTNWEINPGGATFYLDDIRFEKK